VETIILASGSINRKTLLEQVKIPFKILVPKVQEDAPSSENIEQTVKRLAEAKVTAVAERLEPKDCRWVVGLDTLIEADGQIIGKPGTRNEARGILKSLSGRSHRVITAVALLPSYEREIMVDLCTSRVTFKRLADDEIEYYLKTDEWRGAAGAYRIQERGAFFVDSLEGSYSNVVGLPLSLLYGMLRRAKYPFA
jgi:septum formation protein